MTYDPKYIPYLSYIDICRALCEHTKSPVIKSDPGFETFIPPMECFYARSFITEKGADFSAVTADLTEKIRLKGFPKMLSFFTEDSPENYMEILSNAGFVPGFDQAAMYGHLEKLKGFPKPEGEGRLITENELKEWTEAVTIGFGHGDSPAYALYEALFSIENVKIYGWFEHGKIVGTMMAVENGDITGLHEGTVLPEYRRKGIITALICKGAEDFLPKGIRISSMQASAMGAPVYASLGFKETGHIETWIYKG